MDEIIQQFANDVTLWLLCAVPTAVVAVGAAMVYYWRKDRKDTAGGE